MPSLNIEQFGDLLRTTLPKFHTPNYTSLITDTTDHPAAKELVRQSRMSVKNGDYVDFKVKVRTSNRARMVPPTAHDSVNAQDGIVPARVDWRMGTTDYMFYEQEMTINRGESQLIDLIKSREQDAMCDWIQLLEEVFWGFPAATDTLQPFGLPYWCTKNATEGFNGGIPSGYSAVAALSPTTYPRWNNWTFQYSTGIDATFVKYCRKMGKRTNFKPMIAGIPENGTKSSRRYFCNLNVQQGLEDYCDARNMNLGKDVAANDDSVLLRKTEVEYVPLLDDDTTDPFYQLDFGVFKIMVLADWWQRRKVLSPYPGQRNVVGVFLDTMFNFVCYNRRLLGVGATGTSYPS